MRHDIQGIAFDLDGTLYPNYRLNIRLLPFTLKEWRLLSAFGKARIVLRKEQALPNFIPGFKDKGGFYEYQAELTAKLMGGRKPIEPVQLQKKIETLMYRGWEPLFKNISLFKNVVSTLEAFKKAGYKLGLLSDFPPVTKLENLGIAGLWDAVLCSETCGALKPHPHSFLQLAKAMGLPREKILYVGNSRAYDVAGAAAAGMKTAWIRNPVFSGGLKKGQKCDFFFHKYRQLFDYMV